MEPNSPDLPHRNSHTEIALPSIASGMMILCEKPPALNTKHEAEKTARVAKSGGISNARFSFPKVSRVSTTEIPITPSQKQTRPLIGAQN